ncbi:MAG TPA: hypothetical protein VMU99_10775 [Acidimicrobiales bacterium]|nr:hypothetical protein [Acidimicrobiales bacterium]
MANYRIALKVDIPQGELFTYLVTLTNTTQWEPSVTRARAERPGAIGIGSGFDLEIRARTHARAFAFKIVEFDSPQSAVLEAITRAFYSRITLMVQKIDESSSVMDYELILRRRGFGAIFNGLLYLPVRRIGKRARINLEKVLNAH